MTGPSRPTALKTLMARAAYLARAAVLTSAALAASGTAGLAQQAQMPQAPLPVVTVATVRMADFVQRVPIAGNVVARQEVLVSPEVSGASIASLEADIGDRVTQGQVLARLSVAVLDLKLEQADAALNSARAALAQAHSQVEAQQAHLTQTNTKLERARRLSGSGVGTQAMLDDAVAAQATAQATLNSAQQGIALAQAQVQQAQIQRDLAQRDVDNATIKAPVDGIVTARNAQVGAIASQAGQPLFRILQDGAVNIETQVVETELGLVSVGDQAQLEIAGVGPQAGTVRRVDPTVDAQSRLGLVVIEPADSTSLRPGLFAGGWIITARRQGLAVPVAAVVNEAAGSHVLVSHDGTLEKRSVVPGLIWNDQREIISGLQAGEVVLARAAGFFANGDRVHPVPAQPAAGASQ